MARWNGLIGMEPELVRRMNELVARTGVQVVLSSTWRLDDDWRETTRQNGLTFEFLDRTAYLDSDEDTTWRHLIRGEEIAAWMRGWLAEDAGHRVEAYAIIDDDSDMLPGQPLFQTDTAFGLTDEIARRIADHFHASAGAAA